MIDSIKHMVKVEADDHSISLNTFDDGGTDTPLISVTVADRSHITSFEFENADEAVAILTRMVRAAADFAEDHRQ